MDAPSHVSAGLRSDIDITGEGIDPATGRVCVLAEDGTVVFKPEPVDAPAEQPADEPTQD